MTPYYKEKLEQGLYYQDFVTDQFYKIGIPLLSYSSKEYQNMIGENKAGIEIKNDTKFPETGNLYIEVAEKSNPENRNYIDSGILRKDNTWLYVIGNMGKIFIFSKKQLVMFYQKKLFREVQTPTSKGFLIPVAKAEDTYAIRVININKGDQHETI
jgi:hypothetical protein